MKWAVCAVIERVPYMPSTNTEKTGNTFLLFFVDCGHIDVLLIFANGKQAV